MTSNRKIFLAMIIGISVGAGITYWLGNGTSDTNESKGDGERKPLYWVAPMDPNYRRDKPGKSPMGMDLIPVYEEDNKTAGAGPGTVSIAPNVVNSLGVRVAPVEKKQLLQTIKTVGYVQYNENLIAHVHPRVSGWIETLHVKAEGDEVEKGAPLYDLYSPDLVNAQEEYLLALQRNNSGLIAAARERLKALQLPEAIIQQLQKQKQVQNQVRFYAPLTGVIDTLNIREGMFVQPGNTLISIADLSSVWVEGELFEHQADIVSPGDSVRMTLDYLPGKEWYGTVNYIYPKLNPKTRTVKVRVVFDNSDRQLKPNMFAQLIIQPQLAKETLVVPREAVIRTGNQDRVVLALGEGRFKSIAVKLGRKTRDYFEVLEGLNAGDNIVISAQFLIDSESSKTSDFLRMNDQDSKPTSVWVAGKVNSVDVNARKINVDHDAIDVWEWPAMTMDFSVDDSVDLDSLTAGTELHMQVTKLDSGGYAITGVHIMTSENQPASVQSATVDGEVKSIKHAEGVAIIHRGAIEKWGRGPATIEFKSDPESIVHSLKEGQKIRFTFEIRDGEFVITKLHDKVKTENSHHGHH
jgi:Cu(I)/Ag(I) efflux system membrane fusion protein